MPAVGVFIGDRGRTPFSGFRRSGVRFDCVIEAKSATDVSTVSFAEVADSAGSYVCLLEIRVVEQHGDEVAVEGTVLSCSPFGAENELGGYVLGLRHGRVRFLTVGGIVSFPCTERAAAQIAIALQESPRPWVLSIEAGRVLAARKWRDDAVA